MAKFVFLLVLSLFLTLANAAIKLGSYNVDPSKITVSGLSAGGAMAVQFHYAYSLDVHGAGIFAGLPFSCAKGGLMYATQCMTSGLMIPTVAQMITETNRLSGAGQIDNVSNMNGHRAFIFHGTVDYTVYPANGDKIKQMYDNFGVQAHIHKMAANHGQPTSHYGASCSSTSGLTQYINNCNYKGAYLMFDYLYGGNLTEPNDFSGSLPGDFTEFDQTEFLTGGTHSMDSVGYVYIPSGCKDKSTPCKFHIAFHGCMQSKGHVGDAFATRTGYMQAAELNNIIVIFPQAKTTALSNPNGCFEWWPYINANFLHKGGVQMSAVYKMLTRVVHEFDGGPPPTTTTTPPTQAPCKKY